MTTMESLSVELLEPSIESVIALASICFALHVNIKVK